MKKYLKSFGKLTNRLSPLKMTRRLKKKVLKTAKKVKTRTLRRNIFNRKPKRRSKKRTSKKRPKRKRAMKGGL
tara:strand:+ start:738 stop:956 length:219 start_codon:yes stop_codon:yes gene_type:complete